ncbi:hypothetical protein FDUTEX481_03968 [Tolypothrix sp. PCC 7601]|nr:hypothetical protein FDUTEX481_03968 [Tolypothrix sp. PCC 7601]
MLGVWCLSLIIAPPTPSPCLLLFPSPHYPLSPEGAPSSPVPSPQSPVPITPYPQRGPRVPQSPVPSPQSPTTPHHQN